MKLYVALTNELNSSCFGYTEIPVFYIKPQQDEESFNDFLFRLVNTRRRIENSNIHGFNFVKGNHPKIVSQKIFTFKLIFLISLFSSFSFFIIKFIT